MTNLIDGRIGKLERQFSCFNVKSQDNEIRRFDQICALLDGRLFVVAQTLDAVPGANKNLKRIDNTNVDR